MSIIARLEDAQSLYECGHKEGALIMLLVCIAATARKRYPRPKYGDREAFTKFVAEEWPKITGSISNVSIENMNIGFRGTLSTMPEFLYKALRNQLVHEASMPESILFVKDPKLLMQGGSRVVFNEVFLQGLANIIHPRKQPEHSRDEILRRVPRWRWPSDTSGTDPRRSRFSKGDPVRALR